MHPLTQALRGWSNRTMAGLLLAWGLCAGSAAAAQDDLIKALQGAWVSQGGDCAKVFEKIQGKVRFRGRTFVSDNGFIISGNKARGPAGGICTISEIETNSDGFSAQLSCTDTLVSRDFSMVFRIVDPTHFERLDPSHPELATMHSKCDF